MRALLLSAATAASLLAGPTLGHAQAPVGPQPTEKQLQSQFARVQSLLTRMADKMPADAYGFEPAAGMRTFGGGVWHAAASNFNICSNLLGRKHPQSGTDLSAPGTGKEVLVKALADSFAFCGEFIGSLTAERLTENRMVTLTPPNGVAMTIPVAHGGTVANLIAHNNEMYGYLAVYLRLKGIVPPSSERPPQ